LVEIQSAIEMAEQARKVKKPQVAASEKKRLEEFNKQLRSRSAKQPKSK
jgi:hypothetical protein